MRLHYFTSQSKGLATIFTGPAGTGKTETMKDICQTIGQESVVLNCSDILTASDLENMLRTAAVLDMWVMFDEANRITREVLDALGEKIGALYASKESGESDPFKVGVQTTVGLTANPGYAGSTEFG